MSRYAATGLLVPAHEIRLVGLGSMQREAVLLRVDRHGAHAELVRGAHHADGDLAAVGDQQAAYPLRHGRFHFKMRARSLEAMHADVKHFRSAPVGLQRPVTEVPSRVSLPAATAVVLSNREHDARHCHSRRRWRDPRRSSPPRAERRAISREPHRRARCGLQRARTRRLESRCGDASRCARSKTIRCSTPVVARRSRATAGRSSMPR